MVAKKTTFIFIILASILYVFNVGAATINVKTDRSQVSLNESFQLIFEADGSVDEDPDFSPLEKSFQVLSTAQSSNFSVLNGRISSAKRWTLTVMANAPGVQAIPPISFGRDESPVITIDVQDLNYGRSGQQQDDIYLEASAIPLNPYVQSQVIYTLKLYRSVAIAKASLDDPEITSGDAVLERIDDDKSYETTINGKGYQVIERNYAVYPQSSGEISIAPINFMGQISRSRFGMDPFGSPPRTIVRRSQPVTLNVRPIPTSFNGNNWLPAKNLTIAEEWSADPLTLHVGEPITRTLILTATGLISSQLPELPTWDQPEIKFYPDRPQLSDEKFTTGITSIRREKAAIIPNQPGNYVLPEVLVPWWNTTTDKQEQAVVPERTILVLPAAGLETMPTDLTSLLQPIPQAFDAPQLDDGNGLNNTDLLLLADEESNIWKWTTLLLLLVWLITIAVWRKYSQKKNIPKHIQRKTGSENITSTTKQVNEACESNDPARVKESLLVWSKLIWKDDPPLGIGDIANKTDPALRDELIKLNRVLYSHTSEQWTGDNLNKAFTEEAKRLSQKKMSGKIEQEKLEPLFKIS
ncbi:MAG: hypothetical protein ACI9XC_002045 [Gammaproteobacteria bacterium]|jgi:hypothetical protein